MGRDCGAMVLVVDDDSSCRDLVSTVLGRAGFSIVEAGTGEEAVEAARRHQPKLVVLDVRLPDISGYEVCHQLRQEFGEKLAIVFVSGTRTEGIDLAAGLLVGADDYIVKPFSVDELVARVRLRIDARAGEDADLPELTRRELQVLRLLGEGLSHKEIASELVISSKTVGSHTQHILTKFGVHSRTQAIAYAYRFGLLSATTLAV